MTAQILPVEGVRKSRRRPRGTALLECALVLPLLLLVLLGTLEVGRLMDAQQVISQAAGAGGRQASLGTQTNDDVKQAVLNYLQSAGIPTTHATITVRNLAAPDTDVSDAVQLDPLEVSVSVPAADISWTGTSMVADRNGLVGFTCQWASGTGQAYPASVNVPPGY